MGYGQDSGIFELPWLCSTVREIPDPCGTDDGKNVSEPDTANSERVSIEGIDLYGLKMAYYAVHVSTERDPLFGEDQLEYIERAFWFMGYVTQLPPNVRTYQLQGIWGEDVVQVYVANGAFKYFSTYGGADRNTPEVYEDITPRIGDIVRIPNNGTLYEIVDVKAYEEAFGLNSRYSTITMRVYKDTKRPVAESPTIPADDPIRDYAPSVGLEADRPTPDTLRLEPEDVPDGDHVDLFDWEYKFRSDETL
jgi:hypothetical protein